MKIRYFTIEGEDSANEFKKLKDFNLFVEVQYSGCDDYHNVIVSDKKLSKKLLEEILEYPPDSHDWSDSEHDIK